MAHSIGAALDWWGRYQGDEPALDFGTEIIDYRTLSGWSSAIARSLNEGGVVEGDRVGLIGGNTADWAAAAFGVVKAGAVLVPLNARLVAPELAKLISDAGATVVIADEGFEDVLVDVQKIVGGLEVVPFARLAELRDAESGPFRIDRPTGEPACIMYTSGSTGLSKGVVFTNRTMLDIIFEASLIEEGFHRGSRTLLLVPFSFTPGLLWGLFMNCVLGGTVFVEATLDGSSAVRRLEQHKIETVFGVPMLFQVMAAAPEFAAADLSHIRTAMVGGAAVHVPLLKLWAEKGVKLRQIYGMTEIGGNATATWPSEFEEHPDSCGSGSIFTEFKVIRPDGTECEAGETGEIVMRGPGMSPGYWRDPESTNRAFRDGWLRSGDLGARDEAGRLTFIDRLKDLIISGGINISPIELEQVIAEAPGVREVAVLSAKDDKFGETPAAIVTVDDSSTTEASIVEFCMTQMADYKVPRYVVIRTEDLPRLASGKISKPALREEYHDISDRYEKVR